MARTDSLSVALSVLVAVGIAIATGSAHAHGDGHHDEHRAFGQPGVPAKVSRSVAIDMNDAMRYSPARIDVKRGETIRFVVQNSGRIKHEIVLGTLKELREHVSKEIGEIARPRQIMVVPELPKTRSGKIMRRLLRDVAENRPLGDTTTLADPTVVDELRSREAEEQSKED